jgi:hypothetical protein
MLPDITIVMTTWFVDQDRVRIAEETLAIWNELLHYEGNIRLHVADDGSTLKWKPEKFWNRQITYSRQERKGVGASLNAGFEKAYETSPLVAYFVDDWRLLEPIDITPWCKALLENEDIGIMRLGPPHPFLRGKVEIVTTDWQGWALNLDPYGFCVGHRPEIFHKRWTDKYRFFESGINACEVERRATVKWADDSDRLKIMLALPHKFYHVGQDKIRSLSEMEPGEEKI